MRHFRTRRRKAILVAAVLGAVLLLTVGYRALSGDPLPPAPQAEPAPTVRTQAPDVGTGDLPDSFKKALGSGVAGLPGFGTSGKDPFDNMSGSTQIYHVGINLRTDGRMKFIYRYRTGYSAVSTASGSTSVTRHLRGPRAVAQVFVQLIGGSYATCSITIDGETVSTTSARKMYDVVACTG